MSLPRYERYRDTGDRWLGQLPEHWEALPNKVVFSRCKTDVGSDWNETQLLSLTLRGVIVRDIDSGDGKYPADFGTYQVVEPNDLVFCLFDMDETPRTVGLSKNRGMITGAYDVFRCRNAISPVYVYYFYLHIDAYKGLRPFYTGLRKTVRTPTFLSIKMPVPPPDEQKAISSFLDVETSKIDSLVSEQHRLIELLKEKRQAVVSHAVTKGLNPNAPMKPSGIQWLGDVPQHWRVLAYRHLVTRVVVGIAEAATHAYAEEGVPIVRSTNIKTGTIDQSKMLYIKPEFAAKLESKALHAGDVVVTRTGANVGVSAVVPESLHMSQCFTLVITSPKPESNPEYYNHFINSTPGRLYIDLTAWGSGQPNISVSIIQRMHTVAPPREEQDEIVAYIESVSGRYDGLIAEAERAIELFQERRTALISAAVTGKIDVRNFASSSSTISETESTLLSADIAAGEM
jgi:type I restriction enzyme S subunit